VIDRQIAALYVATGGAYFDVPNIDPWDMARDARTYNGADPVVAHPPCYLWVNLAAVNWKRYRRERPAWYPGGSDGGCFAAALAAVRRCGGVLEHPAFTMAWDAHELARPRSIGWSRIGDDEWTCEVWQSAYGHRARKRTWLYFVGAATPPELDWSRPTGDAQIGWFDRIKPTLSKKEASATPIAFRDVLIALARGSR
jgi:hypothetical protein